MATTTTTKTKTPTTASESGWKQARTWIAIIVLGFSIAGVVYLGLTMINAATDKEDAARYVLASILPLLGTWVGTVLAFYFSKDNFESATRSTKELLGIDQKLAAIAVTDVMLSIANILKVTEDDDTKIVLNKWLETMDKEKKGQRLPVLDSKNKAKYVIHRSIITDYLASEAIGGTLKTDLEKKTLKDLIDAKPELKSIIVSFGAVKKDATLDKVKAIMEQSNDTQDVFITENGKTDGVVLGWITNVIVDSHATV